jgi:sRNA-binding regulator protein Hfq
MNYPKRHAPRKNRIARTGRPMNTAERTGRHPNTTGQTRGNQNPNTRELANPETTGKESSYLKSLIDSHTKVTVTMTSGEQFQGHIRYYDHYCFSVGLTSENKKIFLRKDSVSHIEEA